MRIPQIVKVSRINPDTLSQRKDGRWLPARSEPYCRPVNVITRLRLACQVFTGRYDALDWEDEG